MRYANPSTAARIGALQEQGCDRILLVPLYPQYAAATTATACDEAFRALMRHALAAGRPGGAGLLRDPAYIDADRRPRSARTSPGSTSSPRPSSPRSTACRRRYLDAGDPYHCQCQKTSRLVREALGWPTERWHTTFQSRFGNDPWLQPYTIETVERLAKAGVKRLAIVAPGFSADCLETLEELDMENRAMFLANGGEKFTYVPASTTATPACASSRPSCAAS